MPTFLLRVATTCFGGLPACRLPSHCSLALTPLSRLVQKALHFRLPLYYNNNTSYNTTPNTPSASLPPRQRNDFIFVFYVTQILPINSINSLARQ
ncbi:hypothetical protein F5Y09DRAFT_303838 [Xylaria sp. FL1042]|nr:hypothetical protein F5Y09DRAFT_303838 [Xylaria sp. FL1042]